MTEQGKPVSALSALRYRSARAIGTDSDLSPAEVYAFAARCRDTENGDRSRNREHSRDVFAGLATRPDLDRATLTKLCRDADQSNDWNVRFLLLSNPAVRHLRMVQNLIGPDLVMGMLDDPDLFAESIVRLVGSAPPIGGLPPDALVVQARQKLSDDQINAVLTAWVEGGDEADLDDAARTPLLTEHGWDLLLARPLGGRSGHLNLLAQRADLTVERAMALFRLVAFTDPDLFGHAFWVLSSLVNNPVCPAEVFASMIRLAKRFRSIALDSPHCPDEVRWSLAVRTHRPDALLRPREDQHSIPGVARGATGGPIPGPVAEVILADLETATGKKALSGKTAQAVRKRVATLADDPAVLIRLLGGFHAAAGDVPGGTLAFFRAATERTGFHRRDEDGQTRQDRILGLLAAHADGQVRAFVVPSLLHPDDLRIAAADPHPAVRLAVVEHPALPGDLAEDLVKDLDEQVRLALSAREDLSLAAYEALARDTFTPVRLAMARRDGLATETYQALARDPDPQVKQVIAERFMTALTAPIR